jgi:hypothetical protein
MADLASFSVVSYNCRGLSALKRSYVKSLLAKATILFLQEHWLTDDRLRCLDVIDDNFSFTGVAGFDNKKCWTEGLTVDAQLCGGRTSSLILKSLILRAVEFAPFVWTPIVSGCC